MKIDFCGYKLIFNGFLISPQTSGFINCGPSPWPLVPALVTGPWYLIPDPMKCPLCTEDFIWHSWISSQNLHLKERLEFPLKQIQTHPRQMDDR